MPYVDRQNRSCGFLDIEENENSNKFQRRYFILDTQNNLLIWYMDNPQDNGGDAITACELGTVFLEVYFTDFEDKEESVRGVLSIVCVCKSIDAAFHIRANLPSGANAVGSLPLTYISKVSEATAKQKPKAEYCFVINALSRRYFLQANDLADLKEWVIALNNATKITVPKVSNAQPKSEVPKSTAEHQPKRQQAYKTEIIGGVVVHTPINQNEGEDNDPGDAGLRTHVRGLPSSVAVSKPGVVRWGFCVKQGNVRKSWKRRFFTLDDSSVSYYKCDTDKEPLRAIPLKDIHKVHECFVKSGELLLRDNLFEIITSARIFYIQTDTPEDMHAWIKAISSKIQELQGPVKESLFNRTTSLHRGNKPPSSGPRRRQAGAEERKAPLTKSCSVAPSWQPWTPVNTTSSELLAVEEGETVFSSLPPLPAGPEKDPDPAGARRRHRSQPQANTDKVFPFNIDDDGIRTTDV